MELTTNERQGRKEELIRRSPPVTKLNTNRVGRFAHEAKSLSSIAATF